jgi:hypothetical protein
VLELWRWQYTDAFGKRRTTRYLLTEAEALQRLRDPVKVEHTLERRDGIPTYTSDFQKSKKP